MAVPPVDGLVESLERAQVERLTYLENLQHKVNEWQHDRGKESRNGLGARASCEEFLTSLFIEGLQHLCTEVDQMEGRKINFRKCMVIAI